MAKKSVEKVEVVRSKKPLTAEQQKKKERNIELAAIRLRNQQRADEILVLQRRQAVIDADEERNNPSQVAYKRNYVATALTSIARYDLIHQLGRSPSFDEVVEFFNTHPQFVHPMMKKAA